MNDKLDEMSLKLMQSIYSGSQTACLGWAAEIRRVVLRDKMKDTKDEEELSDILTELSRLASVFPKGGEADAEEIKA